MMRKPRSVKTRLNTALLLIVLILVFPATIHSAWAKEAALRDANPTHFVFLALITLNQTNSSALPTPSASPPATKAPSPVTIEAAGDIAAGGQPSYDTAALIEKLSTSDPVITLGDNAYPNGSADDFTRNFDPTWGRFKFRIYPSPGNHDFNNSDGSTGYFDYYIDHYPDYESGDVSWYSFNLGAWHIISLNSNCWIIGGDAQTSCAAGSEQERWLQQDLKNNPAKCTLAFWHAPLFNSGSENPPADWMKPIWDDLYAAGVDVVLNGHAHSYERFKPQDPEGNYDPQRGILEIVAGTGGNGFEGFNDTPANNSVIRNNQHYGVVRMVLSAGSYTYEFISVDHNFSDSGSGVCH